MNMDQIYREYSEKYKHILHYAGIMKKENVLFENQEIIVLKDVKDYQNFDYSYFENCEIEKKGRKQDENKRQIRCYGYVPGKYGDADLKLCIAVDVGKCISTVLYGG